MTMWADDPKWSFVRLRRRRGGWSRWWRRRSSRTRRPWASTTSAAARDFVRAADAMIAQGFPRQQRVLRRPGLQRADRRGPKIAVYNVGREDDGMYGLGIPSDLEKFLAAPVCRRRPGGSDVTAVHGGSSPLFRDRRGRTMSRLKRWLKTTPLYPALRAWNVVRLRSHADRIDRRDIRLTARIFRRLLARARAELRGRGGARRGRARRVPAPLPRRHARGGRADPGPGRRPAGSVSHGGGPPRCAW